MDDFKDIIPDIMKSTYSSDNEFKFVMALQPYANTLNNLLTREENLSTALTKINQDPFVHWLNSNNEWNFCQAKKKMIALRITEILSLSCLLLAGILLLVRLSGARFQKGNSDECCRIKKIQFWLLEAIFNRDSYYWILFVVGMILLIFNRSILLFYA